MGENLIQELEINGERWFEISQGLDSPEIFPTRFEALKFLSEEGLLDEE